MASVNKPQHPTVRARGLHRNLERNVLLLALLGGLPAALALGYVAWTAQYSFEVRWTLAAVVTAIWVGCAVIAFQMVTHAPALVSAASGQDLPDFIQREAELLSLFNEAHPLDRLWCEETESTLSAQGGRQKPPPFVIAHGVNAHAGAQRDLSDANR